MTTTRRMVSQLANLIDRTVTEQLDPGDDAELHAIRCEARKVYAEALGSLSPTEADPLAGLDLITDRDGQPIEHERPSVAAECAIAILRAHVPEIRELVQAVTTPAPAPDSAVNLDMLLDGIAQLDRDLSAARLWLADGSVPMPDLDATLRLVRLMQDHIETNRSPLRAPQPPVRAGLLIAECNQILALLRSVPIHEQEISSRVLNIRDLLTGALPLPSIGLGPDARAVGGDARAL